jgi:sugar O-acyltransferase (sialic acid O-acetyltransferase NeuD family)
MKKVVIIGAGGFGRETLDLFEDQANPGEYEVLGFIVQSQYAKPGEMVHGKPILGDFDWLEAHSQEVYAICSLGAPHQRRRLVELARKAGARFCSVINRLTMDGRFKRGTIMGEGSLINADCRISSQIQIGNHVQINADTLIGHNSVLKDFVTVSPGCLIAGDVTIEEGAFIGMGAIIIEKTTIGAWSAVGAGATVINNVPANTTVAGVPAKVVQTRPDGWQNIVE